MKALQVVVVFLLLCALISCRKEAEVQKVSEGEGYLLLDPERKIRIPVKLMEIYLVDPSYQNQYPEQFEITGPDLHLVGKFPMNIHVGYGEHFDQMIGRTIDISSSGNPSHHEEVSSYITVPGQLRSDVVGGTLKVTGVVESTLHGNISLNLEGAQTLSGAFVFHATTWG